MHQPIKTLIAASLLFAAIAPSLPVRADDFSEKGRDVFAKNQHAVVTLQVVQKVTARGKSSENKLETTGTVVDPSGLAVLSLSSCDPSELSRRLYGESSAEIEITDLKFLLEDGTEVPGEIVLRDKDLDLAFVRPKTKPATPMAAIDLAKSSHAQVLDQLVALNRLKRAAGRAYSASMERVSAVVQKPRTFYIPDAIQTETSPGSPVFTLDGGIVGIVVYRAVSASGGNARDCITPIILPAEDIAKAAAQAPTEVKPEEPKKETPAKTEKPAETPAAPAAK
jgi:S1-C subfamily serine protease